MIGEAKISAWRILVSALVSLMLAILALPHWLAVIRPNFLLLIVIYWTLNAPRVAGLTFAWLCGFAVDILHGVVLGQHAFTFLIVGAITQYFQLRLRIFPIWQQAWMVLLMLLVYEGFVFWIDGIVGKPVTTLLRWLPAFSGALIWPLVVATLDTWNRRQR